MKTIIKDSLILFLITVIAGVLLGGVYTITKEPIAAQNEKAKQEAYKKVFMDSEGNALADKFDDMKFKGADGTVSADNTTSALEDLLDAEGYSKDEINAVAVATKNSATVGYVVTVTAKDGYSGDIKFSVGILADGTVNGISMLSISETAGLGMRAKEDSFTGLFVHKKVDSFKVTKTGATADNEIDALSGSTITSKAVTNGVNSAIVVMNYLVEGGVGIE